MGGIRRIARAASAGPACLSAGAVARAQAPSDRQSGIKSFIFCTAFAFACAPLCFAAHFDAPVRTHDGLIAGAGATASGIYVFKGIPFAASTAGTGRWRAPAAPKPWKGVLKADHFAPACYQRPSGNGPLSSNRAQSEDCLYLNIWTPAKSDKDELPVMVWIYGGGYTGGSTSGYDGENLAKKGVVFVSIAYRVGILGFFAYPELTKESPHHASGNYGILDQIAALKWVRANIAAFGGDPRNVTIFGQSAGSGSANILQASPLAKGLFVRAIGESTSLMDGHGAAGTEGFHSLAEAEQQDVRFAQSVGETFAELRKMPADKLMVLQRTAMHGPAEQRPVERPIENDGHVLPGKVYDIFAAGKQNDVDLLVGSNSEEGKIPSPMHFAHIHPSTEAEKIIYQFLYGDTSDPIRYSASDSLQWQAVSWATLSQAKSHKPTYVYFFAHNPPPPPGQSESDGPIHGAEIIYVFNNLQTRDAAWTDADRHIADLMSSYWTNFARTGNPNGPGLPQWPQFDPASPQVLEFTDTAMTEPMPHQEAMHFMDAYFARLRAAHDSRE
jgi:para-nitrobenzyl esterase